MSVTDWEAVARSGLGDAYPQLKQFHDLLAGHGVTRGLIGPREVPRLWDRHLLNSAAVAPLLPAAGTVIDVGSGAGLPGVVLACLRPDLHTILLEPMERRTAWLTEVVEALGLSSVEVVRRRAEDSTLTADVVTARAVAPMDRLAGWTLPLLRPGGTLLAMKGSRAAAELAGASAVIAGLGGGPGEVVPLTPFADEDVTMVVRVEKVREVPRPVVSAGLRRPRRKRDAG